MSGIRRCVSGVGVLATALAVLPGTGLAQTSAAVCSQAPTLPSGGLPERPEATWTWFAEPSSVYHWGGREEANLGVGHLPVVGDGTGPTGPVGYGWAPHTALPMWDVPNGTFAGWIAWGQVYEAHGPPSPFTGVGTVETAYEDQTIYVLQSTVEGWLQIRLRAPTESDDGLRWTHSCHLSLGERGLEFESWNEVIQRQREWLVFRSSARHALRESPGAGSALAGWIGDDHEIELLEMDGDWARIRVREPAVACRGDVEEFTGTEREGWIRWFGEDQGPWLWYYTRGC